MRSRRGSGGREGEKSERRALRELSIYLDLLLLLLLGVVVVLVVVVGGRVRAVAVKPAARLHLLLCKRGCCLHIYFVICRVIRLIFRRFVRVASLVYIIKQYREVGLMVGVGYTTIPLPR